ncbi:glycosyltransferase family 4 protein [Vibrio tritonius]|uniref:glycosyltransferase family 4 protein n=1 Tax=Vibrio tritonius TaxID=1435069 RepID=UPI000AE75F9E|nr:glycosyltransferase family 4 protein [Vibrio tritonius]
MSIKKHFLGRDFMSLKKILIVVNVDWFFVSHRLPIALKAIEMGYEVHLAAKDTGRFGELKNLGIITHNVNFGRGKISLLNEIYTLFSLLSLLRLIRPNLVHAVTIKPVLYAGIIKKLFMSNMPFIAAISGLGISFSSDKKGIVPYIVKALYRLALSSNTTKVIFQNQDDRETVLSLCPKIIGNDYLIRGSGVDLNEYSCVDESKENIVVMASRLLVDKGLYQFHAAAKIVKQRLPRARFILAGTPDEGSLNSISLDTLEKWKSEGIVEPIGFCSDMSQLLQMSNLVVFPSFYGEGVPKILIEAAASGRAVITTDNPGCKDAIIHGETGLLVPKKDSEALADAIINLLDDDAKRIEMGMKAREFAKREFDIKEVINKHIDIYQSF